MIYEPIIKAHQKKFKEAYNLIKDSEDQIFEKFVNYSELLQHQPDVFSSDLEFLDLVCIGGGQDAGLDGIAIKVNGYFIKSQEEIEEFLKSGSIDVEFIFIQSKNKKNFECEHISTFINGIRAFFDNESQYPFNENVLFWRNLKDYLYDEDVILQWKGSPMVRCYYVTLGDLRPHAEHEDLIRQFKKDMMVICDNIPFVFQGAKEFKDVIDQNQNKFKAKLPFLDTMSLPGTTDVGNSCVVLCNAKDYVMLLNTNDGIIRKTLFNDNVRDFQGENAVNNEIFSTISDTPERFVLFNNGITIVCSSFTQKNRELEIEDPQIVNGCQTSYILFNAFKKNCNIDNITVIVKVISTNNGDLSNDIVRGTNRQNIVMEEAFEGTKPFHKNFEMFVNEFVADFSEKIYYERRAKQYYGNPNIKQYQIFNLKILTQYSVAALLQKPYKAHLHESVLLRDYNDRLFGIKHSTLPYFAVAYAFLTLERFIKEQIIPKYFIKYKAHLLMIYFRLLGGKNVDLNNERSSDKYANAVLQATYNLDISRTNFEKAVEIFREAERYWTTDLHKSFHVMKEAQIFTDLIIKQMDGIPLTSLQKELDEQSALKFGTVIRIIYSTSSKPFGFISCEDGEEVFFTCKNNPTLKIKDLKGEKVSFNVTLKNGKNRRQAYNIKRLEE